MPKWLLALVHFGIGIQIFPLQWLPLFRWQRMADAWGQTIIISLGPIDLTITSDWGPLGGNRVQR